MEYFTLPRKANKPTAYLVMGLICDPPLLITQL